MTLLRISPTTATAFDAIKAKMARLSTTFTGLTTVEALQRAEPDIGAIAADLKALRILVRGEIATAKARDRDDRARRVG